MLGEMNIMIINPFVPEFQKHDRLPQDQRADSSG